MESKRWGGGATTPLGALLDTLNKNFMGLLLMDGGSNLEGYFFEKSVFEGSWLT